MNTLRASRYLLVAAIGFVMAACGSGGDSPLPEPPLGKLTATPKSELQLRNAQSCDALKDTVADSISELLLNSGIINCIDCVLTTEGTPGVAAGTDANAAAFDAFTGTNNQDAGVDELDLVEADASGNLFTIDGRHIVIANGLPPEDLAEVSSLEVRDSGFINGMLFDEASRRLVVATSVFGAGDPETTTTVAPQFWGTPQVELTFIDVADVANPTIVKRLLIDGFEIAARRIASRVHLVTHFTPNLPVEIYEDAELTDLLERYWSAVRDENDDLIASLATEVRARVAAIVAALDAQDFLPGMWMQTPGSDWVAMPNSNCAVEKPDVTMQYALTTITSIDSDGDNASNSTIMNNAWHVYASSDSIYLAQPSFGWWWDPLQRQETAIYKFAIGEGAAEYRSFGSVTGIAFDSFQFSEHDGFLRVSTHRNEREPSAAAPTIDNNLWILEDTSAGELRVVGSVEGFGANEQIFSTRFLGDRGFVVTFRQIDPLFAFDLTDPFDPVLAGELEIPGVTTYIHPLDDDHLLTIGFDGDEQGLDPGFRLQIFNVRDLAAPTLLHSFVPEFDAEGFTWTRAIWDHLSFNFFPEGGVLTIPVQYWSSDWESHFSGFAAYGVDLATGFEELGRLDHSDFAKQVYCPQPGDPNDGSVCEFGIYLEAADPRRSVSASVDERTLIYTFSDVAIKVSDATDFGTAIAAIPLDYPNDYWWASL